MSRLIIAEKPSLGRAIAAALPNPQKKDQGFIKCGNGDVVTCVLDTLLNRLADAYDDRYKKWNLADLPIVPEQWQLRPRKTSSKTAHGDPKAIEGRDPNCPCRRPR